MDSTVLLYSCVLLLGVFISSISQVMLKKAALKEYDSPIKEYLNPLVVFAYVPVSYTHLTVFEGEAEGSIFRVSQTDSYLPLVFTYDKVIDRTVYDELDPSRKQQALLQGAVVESSSSPLEDANLVFTEERLGFKLESLDGTPIVAGGGKEDETGFSYDGERFTVYRADTRIVLDVQVPPDVDAYVAIAGLSYRDLLPSERLTGSERAETPLYRKQQLAFQDIVYGVGTVDAKVRLSLAGVEKTIWNPTNASHLYGG